MKYKSCNLIKNSIISFVTVWYYGPDNEIESSISIFCSHIKETQYLINCKLILKGSVALLIAY